MTLMPPPVRLDRLQFALASVLEDAVGSNAVVVWAYGEGLWEANFPQGAAVNLTMLGGPSMGIRQHSYGRPFFPPTSILFTVDVATTGHRYIITINDFAYDYDASGGDTVTDIRDQLLALIVGDTESPYSAVATGADGLTVTPDNVGDIWQASVSSLLTGAPTASSTLYLETRATRTFNIVVGCFSRGRSPRQGAWALASTCEAALQSPLYTEQLSEFGVGVWGKGPATDLSELDNGHWMSRVQFDVTLAIQSVFTTPTDIIESVDLGLNLSDPSASITFEVDSTP